MSMADGWLSNLSGGMSAVAKVFGAEKGPGYREKKEDQMLGLAVSPLTCPKCGKPCAGTAERTTCASCGFSSVAEQKTTPVLGKVENPCGQCGAPLTIIGDRKSCHACGWSL